MIVYSPLESAQLAEYKERFYRDDWLRPLEDCPKEITQIMIVRIEEQEYNDLKSQFDEGNFVEDGSLEEPVEQNSGDEQPIEEQEVVQLTMAQILDERIKLAARFAEV